MESMYVMTGNLIVRLRKLFLVFFILTLFLFFFSTSAEANNVRIDGQVKVRVTGLEATLEMNLAWDHSWRDAYNWDAVWIFFKYKTASGDWQPVYLQNGEDVHHVGANFKCFPGKSGENVVGVFVTRSDFGAGSVSTTCKLKWTMPQNWNQAMFNDHRISVMAQAVEMVYVPYGAYYLGDTYSSASFNTTLIDGEETLSLKDSLSSSYSLSAAYPKGYNGFYCMKYELSQEQYVTFLNSLTKAEQQDLLGSRVASPSEGDYIFNPSFNKPVDRNGIILSWINSRLPYVFDNNLIKDSISGGANDGQNIACNYLGVKDLLAYSEWAGLRPMTEAEYEKACRRPFPMEAKRYEYAWNRDSNLVQAASLKNSGLTDEIASVGSNANYGGAPGIGGPLRCGVFGTDDTRQHEAGSGYWGVMEMSGNLHELCVGAIAGDRFNRSIHGTGHYRVTSWNNTAGDFGLRGGSFDSPAERLRISDRVEMSGYSGERSRTVGIRCVRTFEPQGININPGTILRKGGEGICPEVALHIDGTSASIKDISGLNFRYEWYVNGEMIATDASDSVLIYDNIDANVGTYVFKRKAICALGEATTTELTFKVIQPLKLLNKENVVLQCGKVSPAAIMVERNALSTLRWSTRIGERDTVFQVDSNVNRAMYTPEHKLFGYADANYVIYCKSDASSFCRDSIEIGLKVKNSCEITTINPVNGSLQDTVVLDETTLNGGGNYLTVQMCLPGKITWEYGNNSGNITQGNVTSGQYKPTYDFFPRSNTGCYIVKLKSEVGNCTSVKDITVDVKWPCGVALSYANGGIRYEGKDAAYTGNQIYNTVQIGKQCWMQENLNAGVLVDSMNFTTQNMAGINKQCIRNNEDNCRVYGAFYNWDEAMNGENTGIGNYKYISSTDRRVQGVCPNGWHVPSDEDWIQLEIALGMPGTIANEYGWRGDVAPKLKSTSVWQKSTIGGATGTNSSGFTALPSGIRESSGYFTTQFANTEWWASTGQNETAGMRRAMNYDKVSILRIGYNKMRAYSVRCIRN